MNFSRFHAVALGLILVTGLLLYGHTLSFPFVFDDHVYLVDNPVVKDPHSFTFPGHFTEFATCYKQLRLDPDLCTNFILRPITYLTFYLNYALEGMTPQGFRAVNIAIHCANGLLVFLLLSHLLRFSQKRGSLSAFSADFIPLSTALLFLAHPLQTESVTYIVQRFTSLGTFFYLLTLLAHFRAAASEHRAGRLIYQGASVAALVLGMLSKEIVFTAPVMLVILDVLVMGTALKAACKRALPQLLCLPIIPMLIFLTAYAQHNGSAGLSDAINIAGEGAYSSHDYALTQVCIILSYLRLILLPYGQNVDPDFPLFTSLWQPRVLVSGLTILGLIGSAWLWQRKRSDDVRRSLLACSALWYFLTLAIDSSLATLPDLMAEHRTYLPSIGALCAAVCGADLLRTRFQNSKAISHAVPVLMAVWIVALGAATVARNEVWRSRVGLWKDAVAKSPNKWRPWSNLGVAYAQQGLPQEALPCLQRVLQLKPGLISAYVNLGSAQNQLGKYQDAVAVSQAALAFAPDDLNLLYNLGVSYAGLGEIEKAMEAFRKIIGIQPAHLKARLAMGAINKRLRRFDRALKHYKVAASLRPDDQQLRQTVLQLEAMVPPASDIK